MNKIKDLSTVIADNAFRLHPVDEERYELFVCAIGVCLRLANEPGIGHLQGTGWSAEVKAWAYTVHEQILVGVMSIVRCLEADRLCSDVPQVVRDRATRLYASLRRCGLWDIETANQTSVDVDELTSRAWQSVVWTMRAQPGFVVFPSSNN